MTCTCVPWVLPRVSVRRHIAQSMVAVRTRRVRAQAVPLRCNVAPALREVAAVVAVSSIGDVVILAEVDRVDIALAVARVVAHWLHANLGAVLDHDVAVAARGGRGLDDLELVCASRHTIARTERCCERCTLVCTTHELLVGRSRVSATSECSTAHCTEHGCRWHSPCTSTARPSSWKPC